MIPNSWQGLMALAFGFSIISWLANNKFGNRKKLKKINKEIQKYQKELSEATKNNDKKKLKELEKRDSEVMQKTQEMMMLSFKPLLIVLPLFWGAYAFILPTLFQGFMVDKLPFYLPSSLMVWLPWKNYLGARGLFIYSMVLFGFILQLVEKLFEKVKKLNG